MEPRSCDPFFAEFHNTLAHFRQIEQFDALLVQRTDLLDARLFLQFVVVAQPAFVQQVVHHLAALAAKVLTRVHTMRFRARVATVVAGDRCQLLDLHSAKRADQRLGRADVRQVFNGRKEEPEMAIPIAPNVFVLDPCSKKNRCNTAKTTKLCDPTRSRTWIKSLGNSYSIH